MTWPGLLVAAITCVQIAQIRSQGDYNLENSFALGDEPRLGRACGASKFDLAIVLDSSTSIQEENWKKLLRETEEFVDGLNIDNGYVKVSVVVFSNDAAVAFYLDTYSTNEEIVRAIRNIDYVYGQTNTASALRKLRTDIFVANRGNRPGIPNIALVITDGVSNIDEESTVLEADLTRQHGITIFALGIGLNTTSELNGIAGQDENVYSIDNFSELDDKMDTIFNTLCSVERQTPGCTLENSDLVVILDASTSVTDSNYKKMLQFLKNLLTNADIDSGAVRVGVGIYSSDVRIQFHLNRYRRKSDLLDAISRIPFIQGSTNTADGLKTMREQMFTRANGDRIGVPNTCIIITDGISNINAQRTIPEAEASRAAGIHIYAIGIGLTDTVELNAIASIPASKNSFAIRNFEELEGLHRKIFAESCPGLTEKPSVGCGLSKVDLVLILDASTSVTEINYKKMLAFSNDIVDKADIDSGSVRVGALIYSSDVAIQFHLNQYKTTADVKTAIDKIPYIYGSTNSADALKVMHETMFTPQNGDRPDVDNVAFMITDGISNINARRTIPEAEAAQRKGIQIYAIGIGLSDTRELEAMASSPKKNYTYSVQAFDELKGLVDTIFGGKEACVPDLPPVADAGSDVTIQLPVNYVSLDGRRSSDDKKIATYQWIQTKGNRNINIHGEGSTQLSLSRLIPGEYVFTLTVYDDAGKSDSDSVTVTVKAPDYPPIANAGSDVTIQLPVNSVSLDGGLSTDDNQIVSYQWIQTSGGTNIDKRGENSAQLSLSRLIPGEYEFMLIVYDDSGKSHNDSVKITVKARDLPPIAVAGNDVTIQLPKNSVLLDGRRSFDDKMIVQYIWSVDPDDESLILDGIDKSVLNVSGLRAGLYSFTLTVFDELEQTDTDSVSVIVTAADSPPVARAGNDVTIRQPTNSVTLDGSKSSDDVGITRYRWRLSAGDKNSINMSADRLPRLALTNMKPGQYKFSLTVFDKSDQKDIDEVTVTVLADFPPIANAGSSVNITLPMDSITLSASRSYDDYGITKYAWMMILGDRSIVMNGTNGPNLTLSRLNAGIYSFQLTVTDEAGQIATDKVDVVVTQTQTTTPACGLNAVDLVFVVDASTSVTDVNFKKQLNFMKSIISYADIDSGSVRVGALIYSTEVNIQFYLDTYNTKEKILAAIDKIPYIYGSTNTADGLLTMRTELFSFRHGDRDDVPNIAMVITDGVSNINARRTILEATAARDIGIHIYAVGIGLTDTRELENIASAPSKENAFAVTDFDQLKGLETKIFSAICIETTTTPRTTSTTTRRTTTTSRTTAPPLTTPSCGLTKTDLVFILDASTSVTDTNFQKMREFVKDFLRNADINSGSVRVGINIYSSEVQVVFHLNTFNTETAVMKAIDNIPYIYGSTNTADALKVMRTEMFIPTRGDRGDASNIAILVTDGISNINSRRTVPEAEEARRAGIHIYVIGINLTDTVEVNAIATPPASQNSFYVQDFNALKALPSRIFSSVCPGGPTTPRDNPPIANAGRDITIQLPTNDVILSGDSSTDDTRIVKYEWMQISGPSVSVIPSNDPYLTLQNLVKGVYLIELKVTDSKGQSDTDTVVITVLPELDQPPTANAGADKQIQLPENIIVLRGDQSTDDKGIVGYSWVLTAPRDRRVISTGDNTDTLRLSNLTEGNYVFTLTVRDKIGQTDSDTVNVKVMAAPDIPPVANAGKDFTIQLPVDSVTLDGSKSLDDIGIVSFRWEISSGDRQTVRLAGQNSRILDVTGLKAGDYEFTLTVTDKKGQKSYDSAKVTVIPAPMVTGYDVIFVLDSSVHPSYFRWMNNYARAAVREMNVENGEFRVGYLTYSNGAYKQFDLKDYETKAEVLEAIDKVDYRPGSKNTAAALKYVRKQMFTSSNGDRGFAKNYVILLTGGNSSTDPFDAATEACQLQNDGVGMFAVSFGETSNISELDSLSSLPSSDYQVKISSEERIGETPGLQLYSLKRGTPRPRMCPRMPTTTARPLGPFKCTASGDVVIILDSSGSVGQENFYKLLNFTYQTVDGLDIDSGLFRVGVVTFSDTSRLDFNLNEFDTKQEIEEAIRKVVYMYGNTHTAHALRRARLEMFTPQAGDRPDVQNVIVIITDGQSNVNHEQTIPEAQSLKSAGISIITVAVGFTSETSELVGITSPPISENLIYVEDYTSLGQLKDKLINPLCTDADLCLTKPCQNGGQCKDGIRSFVCICAEGYYGETCNKHCGEPVDVAIVLDSSKSIGEYNFGRLKEYSEHLIREMNKDSCDINLGVIKYSSAAMVQVNLGRFPDTDSNIQALERISYSPGRSNMAAAFRALRTEMFNGGRGDRSNARNIAYFMTDGTNDVEAEMAEPEAEQTISAGIRIIPIGINLRERFELDNIAQNQGINMIEIGDEQALLESTDSILRPMHEGVNFCTNNPCRSGGTCHNEPFGYRCDCMIGYTGEICQSRCSAKGDLVFAVDTSRYVTRSELKSIRRFLKSVTKRLQFQSDGFNVGLVQFSDKAKVILEFGDNHRKKLLRSSIAGLRIHGGDPEPAQALAKANYRIFKGNGASREKPDYLVLITKSMRDEEQILLEANKLKIQGTRIIGVGLGLTESERDYMQSVVSMPFNKTAIFANNAKALDDIADDIVAYMCNAENKCSDNPCHNDGVCEQLGEDFYCVCGVGYAGKYCENKCEARADIVFLLDSSGSVGHVDFRHIKQFVHDLVSDLQIGTDKTRVGLVTFSSTSRHGFYMNTYSSIFELQNAIAGISYEYGNTNTADGLRMVRERYFGGNNGDRSEIENFLIVITDGVSNVQPDQTIIEAKLIKDKGVHVYAVGIGNFDPYEINSIASEPSSKNAFLLSDFTSLSSIASSIVKKTCRDSAVCDENPCRNGGVCVPGINSPICECRAGYLGEFCQEACVTEKDIYFLLDSSVSIGHENFKKALTFISSIVETFSGKNSYNRFSLITFSTEVQVIFSLGRYQTLPVLQNAIKYARYRPGKTNLAGALRTVKEISVADRGDRYDAENVVFLITDGNGDVNEQDTIPAAEALKDSGARIISIAVKLDNTTTIEKIASGPGGMFSVSSFSALDSSHDDIIKATCKNRNVIRLGK